jgi:hypothetical protein
VFFINIADPPGIVMIDASNPVKIAKTFEIPVAGPHGLDLDVESQTLFCACDAKRLVCLDARSGRVSHELALSGTPDVIFCNAQRHRLYLAIGDPGVIDIVDTQRMGLIETIKTEAGRTRSGSMRIETRSMRSFPLHIERLYTGIKANHMQPVRASADVVLSLQTTDRRHQHE